MKKPARAASIAALFTVVVWGTTFVATKVLVGQMSAQSIMLIRYAFAYLALLVLHPKLYKPLALRDELLFFLAGFSGVTLYYFCESTALSLTLASNVSLLIASVPILTALGVWLTGGSRPTLQLLLGLAVAFLGVFLVIFNGRLVLQLNPMGDLLTLGAALCWAIYTLLLQRLGNRCNYIYTTRKIFFYAIVSMLPFSLGQNFSRDIALLARPDILLNLLYLGLIASALCFVLWNYAVLHLGPVATNNYVYMVPLVTIFTSSLTLREPVTLFSVLGGGLILGGVYLSQRPGKKRRAG